MGNSSIVKLLTEHHLEFLSLKGGCRGSSESTHVKITHCWKSHALAQLLCLFQDHNVAFMETSAKTGLNVDLAFMAVAR